MKRKILITLFLSITTLSILYWAFIAFQTKIVSSILKSANEQNEVESVNVSFFNAELEGLKIYISDDLKLNVKKVSASYDFILKHLISKNLTLENLKIEGAKLSPSKIEFKEVADVSQTNAVISNKINYTPKIEVNEEAKSNPPQKYTINIKNIEGDFEFILNNYVKITAALNAENAAKNLVLYDIYKLANLELNTPILIQKNGISFNLNLQILARSFEKSTKILTRIFLGENEVLKSQINALNSYKDFETQTQIAFDSALFKSLFEDLPQFSINLYSTANFNADLKNANCKLSFKTDVKNLQEISVYFEEINDAIFAADIEFNKKLSSIDVSKLNFGLNVDGKNIGTLKNTKRFLLNTSNIEEIPDGELFRFSLNKFDLNYLNVFTKRNGVEISSAPISAELLIAKNQDKIEAKTDNLIGIKNFTFKRGGNSILNEATFNIFLSAITDFKQSKIITQFTPATKNSNFIATIESSFSQKFDRANFAVDVSGNPSSLFPQARSCGVENININAVATIKDKIARLRKFTANLYGKNNSNLLAANIKNEISIDLSKNNILSKNAEVEILSTDLPSEFLKAFYPYADAEKFSLNANVKIENFNDINANVLFDAKNLTLSNESGTLFENLTFETLSRVVFKNNILNINVSKFRILENATGILTGDANAKFLVNNTLNLKDITADFSASVPKLLQQPFFKKFDNASNGMLELNLKSQDANKINIDFTLSNLSVRGMPDKIEKAELKNIIFLKNKNLEKLSSKLRIATTRGETLIDANVEQNDELLFNINSQKIILEDIETIANALQNRLQVQDEKNKTKLLRPQYAKNAKGLPSANEVHSKIKHKLLPHETDILDSEKIADTALTDAEIIDVKIEELPQENIEIKPAIWANYNKNTKIKIYAQKILKDGIAILENLKAEIFVDKNSLVMKNASMEFYEAPSSITCNIDFLPNGIYQVKNSQLKIKDFDVKKILKENGEGLSFIEGTFDVDVNFFASSNDITKLPRLMQFDAVAKTNGGKMHLVDRTSEAWEAASLGAGFLKLGGTILGGKVREVGELTDIMELLSTVEFSNTTLNLKRGADLNIELLPAKIKTPNAIISIQGILNYMEDEDFLNMPISIPIKLYATNGKLAYTLRRAGYPKTSEDLVLGPEFQITGTLSKTKNNLSEILSKTLRAILRTKNEFDFYQQ